MRKKKLKVAFAKEVKISRDGRYAHVEFIDPAYMSRRIDIGPEVESMTDDEILRLHNEMVISEKRMIANSTVQEMIEGEPQITYDKKYQQWQPTSDVLRCAISSGKSHDELMIWIDDQELSWQEFGRMLSSYMGWGMRIMLLHQEQLNDPPKVEIITESSRT